LGQAHDAVSDELKRLDEATDACLTQVTQTFKEIASLAEKRSMALSNAVKEARDKKKQVLEEQLKLIASEKAKVGIETLTRSLARLPREKTPMQTEPWCFVFVRWTASATVCSTRWKSET
jgi:hypothetical protein